MSEEICIKALRIAESLGAQQAECYYYKEKTTKAIIRKGEIKRYESVKDEGIAIRLIVNKSLGFYYTTNLRDLEKAVLEAYKLAKAGVPDPNFVSLAPKKPYHRVNKIYDKRIEEISQEEVSEFLDEVIKRDYDQRIKSINSELSLSLYEEAIANSLGIQASEKATLASFSIELSASEGNKYSGSFEASYSRFLKDLEISPLIDKAHSFAINGLNKKMINSGEYSIYLDPWASLYIIAIALDNALNADMVQRKRSFLSEDLNKQIANYNLTVVDDALMEGAVGSSSFDGEGVPSQRNVLIEKGILKNFMYDVYTANKENKESTGNAVRNGFRSLPSISSRNLVFDKGKRKSEDIMLEFKRGIYVRSTFDTPNVITGEFSGMINEGFYIENGEIKHALIQAGLAISLRDLFKNIVELSNDARWVYNNYIPYIYVEKAKIAGK